MQSYYFNAINFGSDFLTRERNVGLIQLRTNRCFTTTLRRFNPPAANTRCVLGLGIQNESVISAVVSAAVGGRWRVWVGCGGGAGGNGEARWD